MAALNLTAHPLTVQRGVTLLENMVALLVVSVGLLGFAGMQAFTLHGSASSTHRQLAMQLAQDMADRIRANPSAYFVSNTVNLYGNIVPAASPTAGTDCRATRCTPAQIAAFDIYQWQVANHALPGADNVAGGYVVSTNMANALGNPILFAPANDTFSPARRRFTITIRWDGEGTGSNSVGTTPTDCLLAGANDLKCYSLVIDV